MKNACKHFALCTLTLILCLALAACGSDNSGDSADYGNDFHCAVDDRRLCQGKLRQL